MRGKHLRFFFVFRSSGLGRDGLGVASSGFPSITMQVGENEPMTTASAISRFIDTGSESSSASLPIGGEIRVLHVINGEHYAGAERVQDLLAAELPGYRVSVGFACLKKGKFVEARRCGDAPVHSIEMKGRFDLRAVWRLVQVIRRGGYQILHSHGPRSALVAALASKWTGIPLVHHVHSPTTRDTTNRLRCRLNATVERLAFRQSKALVAVSESLGRYLVDRGVAEEKIQVVPNGVPHRSQADAADRAETDVTRATGRACTLGVVALFRPRKGLEVLLQALAELRRQGFDVRLRAVGGFETSEYESEIKGLCSRLGVESAVDWVGFTRDVESEMRRFDLFVLPSLFGEGMPMVVLEAMAQGLPVVATAVEGVPEVIRDGREGVVVAPGDAAALAAGIVRILNGSIDAAQLGRNALKRHDEKFSEKAMAEAVAGVYRRVLA